MELQTWRSDITPTLMLKPSQTRKSSVRVHCRSELPSGADMAYLCQNTQFLCETELRAISGPQAREWLHARSGGAGTV